MANNLQKTGMAMKAKAGKPVRKGPSKKSVVSRGMPRSAMSQKSGANRKNYKAV